MSTEKGNDNTAKEEYGRSSLKTFFDNTSLHGARFLNDKNIYIRLAWLVALLLSLGFCFYQIYLTLNLFYQRPFSTTITKNIEKEIEFPSVTICNLNPISKTQYVKSVRAVRKTDETDQELEREIQLTLDRMTSHKAQEQMQNLSDSCTQRGNYMMQSISNYSHKLEDMLGFDWLTPCVWRGRECSALNFTSFVTLQRGQCYMFNAGQNGQPPLKTSIPGATNGLRLRLNVEDDDHVASSMTLQSGFKVSVQNRNDFPLVEEFGFALAPGTHTYVAVHPKNVRDQRYYYVTRLLL